MQSASTASNINIHSFSLPRWFDEELGCRKVTDAVPNCEIAKWHKLPNDQIAKWPIHCIRILSFQKLFRQYFPLKISFLSIFFSHPPLPPPQFFTTPWAIWYDEARRKMPDYLCWHPSRLLPTLDQIISGTPPHTWSYLTILAKLTSRWGPPHTWSNDLFRHLYQWDIPHTWSDADQRSTSCF